MHGVAKEPRRGQLTEGVWAAGAALQHPQQEAVQRCAARLLEDDASQLTGGRAGERLGLAGHVIILLRSINCDFGW